MNVGELKKALEGVDDSMPVCVPGYDHSYNRIHPTLARPVEAHDEERMGDRGTYFSQYGGESCEKHYGPKVLVFLVGD